VLNVSVWRGNFKGIPPFPKGPEKTLYVCTQNSVQAWTENELLKNMFARLSQSQCSFVQN